MHINQAYYNKSLFLKQPDQSLWKELQKFKPKSIGLAQNLLQISTRDLKAIPFSFSHSDRSKAYRTKIPCNDPLLATRFSQSTV